MAPAVDVPCPGVDSTGGLAACGDNFPTRKLSGDLKLRLARLPTLNTAREGRGEGRGVSGDIIQRSKSGVGRSVLASHHSNASVSSSTTGAAATGAISARSYCGGVGGKDAPPVSRRLSLTPAKDGFSLVPTSGTVAVDGGVDTSRTNWVNPISDRASSGRRGRGSSAGFGESTTARRKVSGRPEEDENAAFMRELASFNGLQLRCAKGEDEGERHRRDVERRIELQERVVQRPSVGQSKSLLKAKILGSIGGGPFELLRAFRKMHRGRGTIVDLEDFREAVAKLSLGLTEPEILSFFRAFDADGSGGIDFQEFCEWMEEADEDGEGGGSKKSGEFRPLSGGSDKSVSKRKMRDAQAKVKAASEKVPQRTMSENEHLLREKILGSIGGGPFELLRAFRKMHRGRGTVVDLNDFKEAVSTFSLGLGEQEVVAFFKGFDADGSGGIDFEEFCAWVGGDDTGGGDSCLLSDETADRGKAGKGGSSSTTLEGGDENAMTAAQKAQERVTKAFHEQAAKMTTEELHKFLREKLLLTVKPGGGTLLRTYRNLHRTDTGGGVTLSDFKEAIHRYGMGVTDAQVERLFRRYDKDGSGDIDFHEFLKLIVYSETLEHEDPEQIAAAAAAATAARDLAEAGGATLLSPGNGDLEKHPGDGDLGLRERCAGNCAEFIAGSVGDEAKGLLGSNETGLLRQAKGAERGGGAEESAAVVAPPQLAAPRREPSLLPLTLGAKVEEKMKKCVHARWRQMLAAFRRRDSSRTGSVSFEEFQQVLSENNAMQALGKAEVAALASKHTMLRGRVDYPRFMKHLLLSSSKPSGRGAGATGAGGIPTVPPPQEKPARPLSAASASREKKGLRGSKSAGALSLDSPPRRRDHPHNLRPLNNGTSRSKTNTIVRGDNELRDRANYVCRELQPHIANVWKPLWKDLKAADILAVKRSKQGCCDSARGNWGSSRRRFNQPGQNAGGLTGEVETHVFSNVLARHGLELSNRDLMALEHLPGTGEKGWALDKPMAGVCAALAEPGRRGNNRGGRIPYDSFLTTCLVSVR